MILLERSLSVSSYPALVLTEAVEAVGQPHSMALSYERLRTIGQRSKVPHWIQGHKQHTIDLIILCNYATLYLIGSWCQTVRFSLDCGCQGRLETINQFIY